MITCHGCRGKFVWKSDIKTNEQCVGCHRKAEWEREEAKLKQRIKKNELRELKLDLVWTPGTSLAQLKDAIILEMLRACKGNKTQASHNLKFSIRGLRNRLKGMRNERRFKEAV